jgi:pimeloyl-ACP methyl ester carboxylesterase
MPVDSEIYYSVYDKGVSGEKPPVVLIHGAGGTHLYWPSEVRRLPGCRVLALDLPGHGKSGGRGFQSISSYAQVLVSWLETMHLHKAVFVGHSMGGAICLSLALYYPEYVKGLGLVGTAARLAVNPQILENSASPTTFSNAIEMVIRFSFGSKAPPSLVEAATRRMAETRPSVLHGDFLACNAFDVTQQVSEIHHPAIVICGEEDQMAPLRQSQFLATNLPGARLETFPNAGHMVMLEQPQPVADALVRFINSLPV